MKKFAERLIIFWFQKRGWKFSGPLPLGLKQCVIVAGTHSSRLDFFLAVAVCRLAGFRTAIMVDNRFFFFPITKLMHRLGGVSCDYSNKKNLLQYLEKQFKRRPKYSCVLTTKRMKDAAGVFDTMWHTLASRASVPVLLVGLDYDKRIVKLHSWFYMSGDAERDISFAKNFFSRINGGNKKFKTLRSR